MILTPAGTGRSSFPDFRLQAPYVFLLDGMIGLTYNKLQAFGDGTHNQKQQADITEGMIPIEKNINVVDKNRTVFESTWLKRANGLVKKGRARWLDETTISDTLLPQAF